MQINHKSSKMRQHVTIQILNLTSDNAGGQNISWVDFKTIWARVENVTNSIGRAVTSEALFAEQIENKNYYKITTRFISGITPEMRIIYDNKALNIKNINNIDEKDEFLQIYVVQEISL